MYIQLALSARRGFASDYRVSASAYSRIFVRAARDLKADSIRDGAIHKLQELERLIYQLKLNEAHRFETNRNGLSTKGNIYPKATYRFIEKNIFKISPAAYFAATEKMSEQKRLHLKSLRKRRLAMR